MTEELEEGEDTRKESDEYREKISKLGLPQDKTEKLLKEVNRLEKMMGSSQEAAVIRTYLDTCLSLPWNVNIEAKKINLDKYNEIKKEGIGFDQRRETLSENDGNAGIYAHCQTGHSYHDLHAHHKHLQFSRHLFRGLSRGKSAGGNGHSLHPAMHHSGGGVYAGARLGLVRFKGAGR